LLPIDFPILDHFSILGGKSTDMHIKTFRLWNNTLTAALAHPLLEFRIEQIMIFQYEQQTTSFQAVRMCIFPIRLPHTNDDYPRLLITFEPKKEGPATVAHKQTPSREIPHKTLF